MLLKNGTLVNGEKKDILILDGKIEEIDDYISVTKAREMIRIKKNRELEILDLEDRYIMPGIIDVHTHMRDPGFTEKEDLETGSAACAKGGITTFVDMPNTNPATITQEALELKREIAKEKCIVNYGFHFGGSSDDNSDEIRKAKGVLSTKVFLNVTTGKMLIEDDEILKKVIEASNFLTVHAEDEMIAKALEYNKNYGNGLYICHVSSKKELKIIKKAKADKIYNNEKHPVYAEVTPHHLFLDDEMREATEEKKLLYRMKPELKTKEDREYLWKSLAEGSIDTIGTDHAPHLLKEKLEKVTFGMPGVETSLGLMLTAHHSGKVKLEKIQELMCENPAKIFKLKNKGKLEKGYDADIIVINLEKEWTVEKNELFSKCGWSPYEGWKLKGKNEITIVNGNIVFMNNKIISNRGKEVEISE